MYEEFRESYTVEPFFFKNYVDLTTEEAIEVLQCRNDIEVRKWMCSTDEIPLENHLKFIEKLKTSEQNFYWAVYQDGALQGGISLTEMDNYQANSGIFLNPRMIGTGIGIQIAILSGELYFNLLGIRKLYSVVQKDNKNAIQLNKLTGCTFFPEENDFIPIELTKEAWLTRRNKLRKLACIH